jgi:hypothetical protein
MPKGVYDRDRERCGINLDGPNARGAACQRRRGHNGRHLSKRALDGMAAATKRYRERRREQLRTAA